MTESSGRAPDNEEVVLRLFNSWGHTIDFVLEPWGEVYAFGSEDEFLLVARGPSPTSPEIDVASGSVTVSGWPGSTVRLYKNGLELGAGSSERTRVPVGKAPF